jgi:hypothetical protein
MHAANVVTNRISCYHGQVFRRRCVFGSNFGLLRIQGGTVTCSGALSLPLFLYTFFSAVNDLTVNVGSASQLIKAESLQPPERAVFFGADNRAGIIYKHFPGENGRLCAPQASTVMHLSLYSMDGIFA